LNLSVQIAHDFGGFDLDVAFEAPPGVTVLFGRSGSGKTTVINAVAGLLRPRRARVTIGATVLADTESGIWLPPHERQLGVIFQEGRLFPHLSVRQNLLYGHSARRPGTAGMRLDQAVEMLGIEHLLDRRPGALSGGEKQRVAIGRALLSQPRLVLADEPLASLDEARKAEILPYLERLRDELEVPMLYVSHSPAEVARLATTVVVLQQGRVLRHGPALEVFGDPMIAPLGVRAMGAVLEAVVVRHHDDGLTELDAGGERLLLPRVPQPLGARLRVRIPAQEVIVAGPRPEGLSALNILSGQVEALREGEGPGVLVSIRTRAGRVLARVTRRSARALDLREGLHCHAVLKTLSIAPEDVGAGEVYSFDGLSLGDRS
jgi:molybdate transport system ATP-binding protein